MSDPIAPPRRLRYSFEIRCRAVQAMLDGVSPRAAAASVGASRASGYRWWAQFRTRGWAALLERRPVPHHQPRRLSPEAEAEILALRARSLEGAQAIGAMLGRAASTVGTVLRRHGQSRLPRAPREPVERYEWERPGQLLHIDIKKLGRFWQVGKRIRRDHVTRSVGAGWHYVHVAVDDHSRLAYAEVLPSERQQDAVAFLRRALRWYRGQGIVVERVLTDNGSAYRSQAWRACCAELGLEHWRTRPYRPQTNGKAERFIQTLLRRWARAFAYPTSTHRTRALASWLRWYNRRKPHGSLGGLPPISRVSQVRGQYN